MQGLIFQQFKEFIRKKLGFGFWDDIRRKAGVETTLYAPVQAYSDHELLSLLRSGAEKLGIPVQPMLEEFGKFFVKGFVRSRPYLIDPKWHLLDLLEHSPEMLATVEKRNLPDAPAAILHCTRDSPEQVTMRYSSKRKLCGFGRGLIKGFSDYYHEPVTIEEPRCMLRGHSECVYIVRLVPPEPESAPESPQ